MKGMKPGLGIGIVVLAVYLVSMLVLPYFNNYQFDDWIEGETLRGSYLTGKTDSEIREAVIEKAREYDINPGPEQLRVEVEGPLLALALTTRCASVCRLIRLTCTSLRVMRPK
jgi:hypothetical protein